MTIRWTFYDRVVGDTYTVEYNPNTMSTPHIGRGTDIGSKSPVDGNIRANRAPAPPQEWSFGGFIRTEASLLALTEHAKRGNLTELTDHVGRVWLVRFTQFDEQELRPSATAEWRFRYAIKAIMYGRLS